MSGIWHSRNYWRLLGTYGLLVLTSIGLLGVIVLGRVEQHFLSQVVESLQIRATLLAEWVRNEPAAPGQLQDRVEQLGHETATRITLLTDDGTVLADSEKDPRKHTLENHASRPEVLAAREAPFGLSRGRHSSTLDRDMMYVAAQVRDAGPVAFVRVALPLDAIQGQLTGLASIVWTTAALTAAAALFLAFWMARRTSQPLQDLTASAARIAAGDYGHKVHALGQDEVGTLGQAFNHMSDRLAFQFTQLEEDRQQLRAVLSSMVEGVVALDADQRILFTNERAGQLLDFDSKTAVGRELGEVVRQRSVQDLAARVLSGPEFEREDLDLHGPAARSVAVHAACLAGSPARGAVLVFHDTTELRRLERLRRDFVANVSHELKTPLSVIKVCVETLLDGAADDPHYRGSFLTQIEEQGDRLHALILDLLSLARIESGEEVYQFAALPLEEVAQACIDRHRARAESKQQFLDAVSPDEGGAGRTPVAAAVVAWADEEALSQILDNLVDNALKYTPIGGHIRVRWWNDDGHACLEVEDTGIGIPERDLPRIFERFYRVDKARSRELGGTGLGLSIVKHLVQAMKGTVQATSRTGEGTKFTVWLPRGDGRA